MTRVISVEAMAHMLVAAIGTRAPLKGPEIETDILDRFTQGLTDYEREQVARAARFLARSPRPDAACSLPGPVPIPGSIWPGDHAAG
jgi:hypothetical protein